MPSGLGPCGELWGYILSVEVGSQIPIFYIPVSMLILNQGPCRRLSVGLLTLSTWSLKSRPHLCHCFRSLSWASVSGENSAYMGSIWSNWNKPGNAGSIKYLWCLVRWIMPIILTLERWSQVMKTWRSWLHSSQSDIDRNPRAGNVAHRSSIQHPQGSVCSLALQKQTFFCKVPFVL